jgi:hypothetical protein
MFSHNENKKHSTSKYNTTGTGSGWLIIYHSEYAALDSFNSEMMSSSISSIFNANFVMLKIKNVYMA